MSKIPGSRIGLVSRIVSPFLSLLLGGTYCGAAQTKAERIDQVVRYYHEHGFLNGAVLVGEKGRIIYEKGVGEANFASHVPNTPTTRFGIGSITKQFTALLVLQQVDEGKLRLDGTLFEYLPWYRKDTGSPGG